MLVLAFKTLCTTVPDRLTSASPDSRGGELLLLLLLLRNSPKAKGGRRGKDRKCRNNLEEEEKKISGYLGERRKIHVEFAGTFLPQFLLE